MRTKVFYLSVFVLLSSVLMVFTDPTVATFYVIASTIILIACSLTDFKNTFLALIVTKPFIDLTWHINIFTGVNSGRIDAGTSANVLERVPGINFQQYLAALAVALVLLELIVTKSRNRNLRDPWTLSFVFLGMFSTFLSFDSGNLVILSRWLSGVLFFFAGYRILSSEDELEFLMKGLIVASVVPIVLSFFQIAGLMPYYYVDYLPAIDGTMQPVGRASGLYNTPLELTRIFIFTHAFSLYLMRKRTENGKENPSSGNVFLWIYNILLYIVVYFTYHRTTYIIIAMQFVLWTFWGKVKFKSVLKSLATVVVVVLAAFEFIPNLSSVLGEVFSTAVVFGSEGSEGMFHGRGELWLITLSSYFSGSLLQKLFGFGTDVATAVVGGVELFSDEPHSQYLQILHAYGIVGLAVFIGMLVKYWRTLIRLGSLNYLPRLRELSITLRLSLLSIVILGVTIEPFSFPTLGWIFFPLMSFAFVKVEEKSNVAIR